MRFWIREAAGWALVALGLFVFYVCFGLLLRPDPYLLQAGPIVFLGVIVFRGGIHLLKVAVAARICMQAPGVAAQRVARADRAASEAGQPLEW